MSTGVSAAALRPFFELGRMPAGPILALPAPRDPDGPSVGFGAGVRKGAAEPAAGSFRLGSAFALAGDAVPEQSGSPGSH